MRKFTPMVNRETKRIAIIIGLTNPSPGTLDLDFSKEEAEELHKQLGRALKELHN